MTIDITIWVALIAVLLVILINVIQMINISNIDLETVCFDLVISGGVSLIIWQWVSDMAVLTIFVAVYTILARSPGSENNDCSAKRN